MRQLKKANHFSTRILRDTLDGIFLGNTGTNFLGVCGTWNRQIHLRVPLPRTWLAAEASIPQRAVQLKDNALRPHGSCLENTCP